MHLAVGEAVAKAATVKLAAMALVVFASATAALCVLRLPRVPKELGLVEKARDEIASLEKRAKRLEYNLALARESAREAFLRREAERNGDLGAPFWPGCVFFPCDPINSTGTDVKEKSKTTL
ncbi:uncharacterized protein LOC106665904 [Cimex lectularius]|uniref:Uncharacterized protein n=1 Tax=Cimex lectularius TaxID=79782 RepID=A0A8I6RKN9_CIMLE|nr:uncharacterized protein LOC106665904 [Cimex lectularius]